VPHQSRSPSGRSYRKKAESTFLLAPSHFRRRGRPAIKAGPKNDERREIAALFCDLRGFTGFSESSDPEDVMALLREYHAAIGEIIVRHRGTLERRKVAARMLDRSLKGGGDTEYPTCADAMREPGRALCASGSAGYVSRQATAARMAADGAFYRQCSGGG
jgi:class 3 adenylate cyclase